MKILIQIFIIVTSTTSVLAQDYSDAKRLSKMDYMHMVDQVDCDSLSGSTMEMRICLNKKFQQLDSLMNSTFDRLLLTTEFDSTRERLINYQTCWVDHRRLRSKLAANGYQGNTLGIIYLNEMIKITKERVNDLESIVPKK